MAGWLASWMVGWMDGRMDTHGGGMNQAEPKQARMAAKIQKKATKKKNPLSKITKKRIVSCCSRVTGGGKCPSYRARVSVRIQHNKVQHAGPRNHVGRYLYQYSAVCPCMGLRRTESIIIC